MRYYHRNPATVAVEGNRVAIAVMSEKDNWRKEDGQSVARQRLEAIESSWPGLVIAIPPQEPCSTNYARYSRAVGEAIWLLISQEPDIADNGLRIMEVGGRFTPERVLVALERRKMHRKLGLARQFEHIVKCEVIADA